MNRLPRIGVALALLLGVVVGLHALAQGPAKERRVGTIGPPPRKNPERQAAA